jgi:hypothetical protein
VNIASLIKGSLSGQKALKLTISSNSKESLFRTIIGARTTEPAGLLTRTTSQHKITGWQDSDRSKRGEQEQEKQKKKNEAEEVVLLSPCMNLFSPFL